MYRFRDCESELRLLECDVLLLEASEEISQVAILSLSLLVFRLERCELVFQLCMDCEISTIPIQDSEVAVKKKRYSHP